MSRERTYKREWVKKFESGEYLREFRGYSPFWAGCFFGDSVCLGGEEEFSHCYDFFSGIGDVDWWIASELNRLSDEQQDRLESLMKRNKDFKDNIVTSSKIKSLSEYFGIDTHVLYRMGSKSLYRIFKSLNDAYNEEIDRHTRIIEDSSVNFGKFDEFMKFEFEEDLIKKEPKKICDLFNYNEPIVFAPQLD